MKAWCLALVLVSPALVLGESLGDVARKERERREKLQKGGPTARTLTEQDLASTKGTLANDPNAPPATVEGAPAASTRSDGPDRSGGLGRGSEAFWRAQAAQARDRLASAQREYDMYQRWLYIGQPHSRDSNGNDVIYSAQSLKRMADAAEARLRAAEKALQDLEEQARRAGALPGWLR
jgi:hypothetical protein